MPRKKMSDTARKALYALREAVYEELVKKSKLGQYAIISVDGKPCRMPAKKILSLMKKKKKSRQPK